MPDVHDNGINIAKIRNRKNHYTYNCGGCNWCALVRQKAGLGLLTAFDAARFADGAIVAEFRAVVARHAAVQCGAILGTGRCDEAGDGEEDQAARSSHISSRSDGRTQLRVAAVFSRAAATERERHYYWSHKSDS